ncbi:hypothetical protein Rs2_11662 [Raphanus sativus]|nr:hypothetical protein Rs2_11662 [Raphanus sativus]
MGYHNHRRSSGSVLFDVLTPAAHLSNGGRAASILTLPPSLGCGRPAFGGSLVFPSSRIQEEISIIYRLILYAGSGGGDGFGCGFHACQRCVLVKRRSSSGGLQPELTR